MQQQMGQLMDKGGEVQEFKNGSMPRPILNPKMFTADITEPLNEDNESEVPPRPILRPKDLDSSDTPPLPISRPKLQSRGMRNNNPFNILLETSLKDPRKSRVFAYHGTIGVDIEKGKKKNLYYSVFDNIDNGLRAGASVLRSDRYDGKTLETIIKTFSSTDQESYVDFVAKKLNIDPSDTIDTAKDDAKLEELMKAMLEFESTAKALDDISDEQIKNAIKRSKQTLPDSEYYTGK